MGFQKLSSVSDLRVLRSAAIMGVGTFFSRVMGLVREQVFAFLFGASHSVDAFNIAFRIPNLLRDLFAEGAMSAALVPTFTRVHENQGPDRAWSLAIRVFKILFVSVGVFSLFGMVFAETMVSGYAAAFREVPGKFELAVTLTRVMFPFFPLVALAAAFMAVLNARGIFFISAFASALFNVFSVILGVVLTFFFRNAGHDPILGMAVGVVFGGFVQAFCQLPSLLKIRRLELGEKSKIVSRGPVFQDRDLQSILTLMIPGTFGLAATQVNILINSILATAAGPGAVSWLAYAFRLMQFPIGVFGVSLAQATLPRVSAQWVASNYLEAIKTIEKSLVQNFAINLPAAVGLAVLSKPLIGVLFEHGQFGAGDTANTAKALAAYSVGLAAYSGVKILGPVFYAFGKARIPVISSLISVVLTLCFNLISVRSLGFWGLALGTSVAAYGNLLYLIWNVRRTARSKGIDWDVSGVFLKFLLHLCMALVMGGVCWGTWSTFLSSFALVGALGKALTLVFLLFEAVFFQVVLGKILGIRETDEILGAIFERILKRFRKKKS